MRVQQALSAGLEKLGFLTKILGFRFLGYLGF